MESIISSDTVCEMMYARKMLCCLLCCNGHSQEKIMMEVFKECGLCFQKLEEA